MNKDVRVTAPAAGVAGAELLRDASRIDKDRRESGSLAYSKPAILRPSSGGWQAVFTREISDHGVTLVHLEAIEPQRAVLAVELESGSPAEVSIELLWCQPCGNGWHISGGDFL